MNESNRRIISVSELNKHAKRLLESEFPLLFVEGEISNFARPRSGHWYFTLKDEKAQIRCAMFKNRNQTVKFEPKDGQQVIVRGRISLYEGRGEFQMIAEFLEDFGDGALRRAFDKLKDSLQAEGLFDEDRKKPLPAMPSHIAVITSTQGAAIRDVISVVRRRFPALRLSILPVQVQGEESVAQIVEALRFANLYSKDPFDLVLLTRGGGSLEDLWSFNTEPVARAISASRLPIVAAIGHESDVSISDFVADLRAPTPSAAAELITPDGEVITDQLNSLKRRLKLSVAQKMQDDLREVGHLKRRLRHPAHHLNELTQRLDDLEGRLNRSVQNILSRGQSRLSTVHLPSPTAALASRRQRLANLHEKLKIVEQNHRRDMQARFARISGKLDALSPLATLQRGFAIVSNAETGKVLLNSEEINTGDRIKTRLNKGSVVATVIEREDTP